MDREGFRPDPTGVRQLLASPMVSQASLNAARTIERTARAIAPVDTGTYRSSFRSRTDRVPTLTGRGGMEVRAGAVVENTAPHASVLEARRNVLTRAAKGVRF